MCAQERGTNLENEKYKRKQQKQQKTIKDNTFRPKQLQWTWNFSAISVWVLIQRKGKSTKNVAEQSGICPGLEHGDNALDQDEKYDNKEKSCQEFTNFTWKMLS